jgi:putative two-component system response regulator
MNSCPLVLIVDDSFADAKSMSGLLGQEYRIKLAGNGADALEMAQRCPAPDLILLDIVMPGMDGFEVCRQLKQSVVTRDIPVVFVSALHDAAQEARAFELQAADYISKPYNTAVARARIRKALLPRFQRVAASHNGQSTSAMSYGELLPQSGPLPRLGKREMEVMALIAEGLTSAEIAAQLFIAKGTVEVHRENIMRKLGVRNIAGLVKVAVRNGMLAP